MNRDDAERIYTLMVDSYHAIAEAFGALPDPIEVSALETDARLHTTLTALAEARSKLSAAPGSDQAARAALIKAALSWLGGINLMKIRRAPGHHNAAYLPEVAIFQLMQAEDHARAARELLTRR
ncbi:hypothetical protein [Nocardia nepalensis]|uniref:hypothetical protein n=1 Tax=Nocardia nepalensis TaxID=3375448 RepID=UPI003B6763CE